MPRALVRRHSCFATFKVIMSLNRTGDAPCCILLTDVGIESESNSSTAALHSSCHFATAKPGVSAPSVSAASASHQRRRGQFCRAHPPANSPTSQITPLLGHGTSRIRITNGPEAPARVGATTTPSAPPSPRWTPITESDTPSFGRLSECLPNGDETPYLATGPRGFATLSAGSAGFASGRRPRPRRRPRLVGHHLQNPTPRALADRRNTSRTATQRPYLAKGPLCARDIHRAPPIPGRPLGPEARARSLILPLNNAIPEKFGTFWVTAEEMHQRLLHVGVRRSLSRTMVLEALRRNNTAQKMIAVWRHGDDYWYRSRAVDAADAVPADQRPQLPRERRPPETRGAAGAPAADATGAPATSTAVGSREKHCCEALRVTEEFLRTIDVDSM